MPRLHEDAPSPSDFQFEQSRADNEATIRLHLDGMREAIGDVMADNDELARDALLALLLGDEAFDRLIPSWDARGHELAAMRQQAVDSLRTYLDEQLYQMSRVGHEDERA